MSCVKLRDLNLFIEDSSGMLVVSLFTALLKRNIMYRECSNIFLIPSPIFQI
jgi:hypothetical protein